MTVLFCSRLRYVITLWSLFIAVATGIGCSKRSQASAAACVRFEKDTVDLGEIKKGAVKNFRLRVGNYGKSIVRIINFESSCKCIVLSDTGMSLPPSAMIAIDATIKVDKNEHGLIYRDIGMRTSEDFPFKLVTLRAIVL